MSKKIIDNDCIRKVICNRIQYLFIDEFQDIDAKQFDIIETIRKEKNTNIYSVGDPEQYINGYQNNIQFLDIPIMKAINNKQYELAEINKNNFRSSKTIIDFLNRFNGREYKGTKFYQIQGNSNNTFQIPILFINTKEITQVLRIFKEELKKNSISNMDALVITKKQQTIAKIKKTTENVYSIDEIVLRNKVENIINKIFTLTKKTQNQILDEANISKLEFRKIVIDLLTKEISINEEVIDHIFKKLNLKPNNKIETRNHDYLIDFATTCKVGIEKELLQISTIHSVKGLERRAILCFASNKNELNYWLETNNSIRDKKILSQKNQNIKDKELDDYSRIGYVAFSRAKDLLCIACLEELDTQTIDNMKSLNIEIIGKTKPTYKPLF